MGPDPPRPPDSHVGELEHRAPGGGWHPAGLRTTGGQWRLRCDCGWVGPAVGSVEPSAGLDNPAAQAAASLFRRQHRDRWFPPFDPVHRGLPKPGARVGVCSPNVTGNGELLEYFDDSPYQTGVSGAFVRVDGEGVGVFRLDEIHAEPPAGLRLGGVACLTAAQSPG